MIKRRILALQDRVDKALKAKILILLPFLFAPLLSGFLLVLALPSYNVGWLVWVGLVPLFIALDGQSPKRGFLVAFASSLVFFPGIFSWILEVPGYTLLHHGILALYLGFYFGLFGVLVCVIARRWGFTAALSSAPFLWVSLEYIRSNLSFLALPWGLLAHSQYRYPTFIQVASLTGAYGVSFVIVMVNAAVAAMIYPRASRLQGETMALDRSGIRSGRTLLFLTTTALIGFTVIYGGESLSKPLVGPRVKVSVVQGNIEQAQKWDRKYAKSIMKTYSELTLDASKRAPLLIVWPESATPWSIVQDPRIHRQIRGLADKAGAYLLLGSSQRQKFKKQEATKTEHFNSAFLIDPGRERLKYQRYNKIRLFPFGEYLPLKDMIPWSHIKVPHISGYISGEEFTVFELAGCRFSATICWENIFPDLVRQFVKRGARFIVNITNEAWFGKTAAPYQFVSMSVFRAVENRISVARAANTGISCFIDPCGRITGRVKNNGDDIFVEGHLTQEIPLSQGKTFYTTHGDIFVYVCLVLAAAVTMLSVIHIRGYPRRTKIIKDANPS